MPTSKADREQKFEEVVGSEELWQVPPPSFSSDELVSLEGDPSESTSQVAPPPAYDLEAGMEHLSVNNAPVLRPTFRELQVQLRSQGIDLLALAVLKEFSIMETTSNGQTYSYPEITLANLKGNLIVRGQLGDLNFISYVIPFSQMIVTLMEPPLKNSLSQPLVKIFKTPYHQIVVDSASFMFEMTTDVLNSLYRQAQTVVSYPAPFIAACGQALEALSLTKLEISFSEGKFPTLKDFNGKNVIRGIDSGAHGFVSYLERGSIVTFFTLKVNSQNIQDWRVIKNSFMPADQIQSQLMTSRDLEKLKGVLNPSEPSFSELPAQYLPSRAQSSLSSPSESHAIFPREFLENCQIQDLAKLPLVGLTRQIKVVPVFDQVGIQYRPPKLQDLGSHRVVRGFDADKRLFISYVSEEQGNTYINTLFELEPSKAEMSNWRKIKVDVNKDFYGIWGAQLDCVSVDDLKVLSKKMNPQQDSFRFR